MVQAWPDLWGCTGAILGVADIDAGMGQLWGQLVSVVLELQVLQVQWAEAVAVV